LEDDYDSEFRYSSRPLGALQGMDTSGRVIYVGTFSKVLFPALRIGYVIVPRALVTTFTRIREAIDIFPPTLNQLVLTDFLTEGHFARHVRRMRTTYQARRDAMVAAIRAHASDVLSVRKADAGLHLAAFLPEGVDDAEVVREGERRGIAATALSSCYAGPTPRSGLILGFGGTEEARMDGAMQELGRTIRTVAARR